MRKMQQTRVRGWASLCLILVLAITVYGFRLIRGSSDFGSEPSDIPQLSSASGEDAYPRQLEQRVAVNSPLDVEGVQDVSAGPLLVLTVAVRNEAGQEVEGARVEVFHGATTPSDEFFLVRAVTGSDGVCRFEGEVPFGGFLLKARAYTEEGEVSDWCLGYSGGRVELIVKRGGAILVSRRRGKLDAEPTWAALFCKGEGRWGLHSLRKVHGGETSLRFVCGKGDYWVVVFNRQRHWNTKVTVKSREEARLTAEMRSSMKKFKVIDGNSAPLTGLTPCFCGIEITSNPTSELGETSGIALPEDLTRLWGSFSVNGTTKKWSSLDWSFDGDCNLCRLSAKASDIRGIELKVRNDDEIALSDVTVSPDCIAGLFNPRASFTDSLGIVRLTGLSPAVLSGRKRVLFWKRGYLPALSAIPPAPRMIILKKCDEAVVSVVDSDGRAVPYALVCLQSPSGGASIGFQAGANGRLSLDRAKGWLLSASGPGGTTWSKTVTILDGDEYELEICSDSNNEVKVVVRLPNPDQGVRGLRIRYRVDDGPWCLKEVGAGRIIAMRARKGSMVHVIAEDGEGRRDEFFGRCPDRITLVLRPGILARCYVRGLGQDTIRDVSWLYNGKPLPEFLVEIRDSNSNMATLRVPLDKRGRGLVIEGFLGKRRGATLVSTATPVNGPTICDMVLKECASASLLLGPNWVGREVSITLRPQARGDLFPGDSQIGWLRYSGTVNENREVVLRGLPCGAYAVVCMSNKEGRPDCLAACKSVLLISGQKTIVPLWRAQLMPVEVRSKSGLNLLGARFAPLGPEAWLDGASFLRFREITSGGFTCLAWPGRFALLPSEKFGDEVKVQSSGIVFVR